MEELERADRNLLATLLGALVRPRATFLSLADEPNARAGASAVAVLGVFWALLSAYLWSVGHAPPFVLVPIARGDWFLVQALLMLPLLTALWWLFSELSHAIARRLGGVGTEAGTRAALGFAYAAPLLVHVLFELGAALGYGLPGLRFVARISLPAAALGVAALSTIALQAVHAISRGRALGAALAGLGLSTALGSLVLR